MTRDHLPFAAPRLAAAFLAVPFIAAPFAEAQDGRAGRKSSLDPQNTQRTIPLDALQSASRSPMDFLRQLRLDNRLSSPATPPPDLPLAAKQLGEMLANRPEIANQIQNLSPAQQEQLRRLAEQFSGNVLPNEIPKTLPPGAEQWSKNIQENPELQEMARRFAEQNPDLVKQLSERLAPQQNASQQSAPQNASANRPSPPNETRPPAPANENQSPPPQRGSQSQTAPPDSAGPARNPPGQNPTGQNPTGQNLSGRNQAGQTTSGQDPTGQNSASPPPLGPSGPPPDKAQNETGPAPNKASAAIDRSQPNSQSQRNLGSQDLQSQDDSDLESLFGESNTPPTSANRTTPRPQGEALANRQTPSSSRSPNSRSPNDTPARRASTGQDNQPEEQPTFDAESMRRLQNQLTGQSGNRTPRNSSGAQASNAPSAGRSTGTKPSTDAANAGSGMPPESAATTLRKQFEKLGFSGFFKRLAKETAGMPTAPLPAQPHVASTAPSANPNQPNRSQVASPPRIGPRDDSNKGSRPSIFDGWNSSPRPNIANSPPPPPSPKDSPAPASGDSENAEFALPSFPAWLWGLPVAIVGLMGLLWFLPRSQQIIEQVSGKAAAKRAQEVAALGEIRNRNDAIAAFHWVLLRKLRGFEDWWTSRRVVQYLRDRKEPLQPAIEEAAKLYDHARYAPADAPFTERDLERMRTAIQACATANSIG